MDVEERVPIVGEVLLSCGIGEWKVSDVRVLLVEDAPASKL